MASFILLLLSACGTADDMTLDTLVDRHTAARGGAVAVENIDSVRIELEISERTFAVRGEYVASRSGYMRIDIYADNERVFTEALGPDGGWQLFRGESTAADLSPDGDKALQRGLVGNLYGLHELAGLGYDLDFLGPMSESGTTYWAIDLTAPDGFTKRLFFDQATYLLVREVETSALHPDIDATKTPRVTVWTDFTEIDGVVYPSMSRKLDQSNGDVVQTTVLKDVQINPALEEAAFRRP